MVEEVFLRRQEGGYIVAKFSELSHCNTNMNLRVADCDDSVSIVLL